MKNYEILYIIDAGLSDEDKEKTISQVKTLVESTGATTSEPEKWGLRKYAYPIAYKQEGYYVLMNFEANDSAPKTINDKLIINKNIVRHMIVAK